MATNGDTEHHREAVIGNAKNFWLYDSRTGFDLTHPPTPSSPRISPHVTIQTTTLPITIDPAKSALVIIDMQNFFLSSALGRAKGAGHNALDQLVEYAIPAARQAGVRVVWLNWGLSEQEIEEMAPSMLRAFGFVAQQDGKPVPVDRMGSSISQGGSTTLEDGKGSRKFSGMGTDMGVVTDPDSGKEIPAGKLLMRDQWNSSLHPPLNKMYEEGKALSSRPDIWVHKNRMSGMWGPSTACEEFLEKEGIKTLFFTGVNTDQCVGGTLQDCVSKGYDCVLLNDGCGTTSPNFAQQMIEFNSAGGWGFQTTCKMFSEGVDAMGKK